MKTLQQIGQECDSDRSKNKVGELTYYEYYEEVLKFKNIQTIVELGIYYGNGLRTFRKFWPDSRLIGIDASLECYNHDLENCYTYKCDQTDIYGLTSILKQHPKIDLFIDDASHEIDKSIITFDIIFPFLNSGGVYIIEDLQCFNTLNNKSIKKECYYDNGVVVNYKDIDFNELMNFIYKLINNTIVNVSYQEIKITNNSLIIIKK